MNKVTPRIGIRPTIDGRRKGVREMLENQTMGMAKAAAKLLSTLRYPDGRPVECVIADTTIGGVAEAAACEAKFTAANVTATLTVTPCWCYGSETMDMNPLTQKAVWGFNGTERPGAVYLAAVLAAHSQKASPRSASTGATCRTPTPRRSPPTCAKRSSGSAAPRSPRAGCAAKATSRWAASPWASPGASWIRISSRNI